MKTMHQYWTIEKLRTKFGEIEFPEFQREPTVWKLEKKQRLIDSILRDFDISSVYFFKREDGKYDCIDGRQRINAIWSYLGINGADEYHNGFNLKIDNEIYNDNGKFDNIDSLKYSSIEKHEDKQVRQWADKINKYQLNVVEITDIENDEELNLLFLRLQIASVLNAGEKLHAMTGDMRDAIFLDIIQHPFFDKATGIRIPERRYAREQVAAQIVLNEFSRRDNDGAFHRSRYVDLQEFFKQKSKFEAEDKKTIQKIQDNLTQVTNAFGNKLKYVNNRAMAVSVYLFIVSRLIVKGKTTINLFVEFFIKFLRTLRWQIPLGVKMDGAYYDLLQFQTNVSQAAGEKSAIERRSAFLEEYFNYYEKHKKIKGDEEYEKIGKNPNVERDRIRL